MCNEIYTFHYNKQHAASSPFKDPQDSLRKNKECLPIVNKVDTIQCIRYNYYVLLYQGVLYTHISHYIQALKGYNRYNNEV